MDSQLRLQSSFHPISIAHTSQLYGVAQIHGRELVLHLALSTCVRGAVKERKWRRVVFVEYGAGCGTLLPRRVPYSAPVGIRRWEEIFSGDIS